MDRRFLASLFIVAILSTKVADAQSFGLELFNNVTPRSGGMAGASISTPQDLQSAVKGNPATLTQFHGTQFGMSGVWIEPTVSLSVDAPGLPLLGVAPFPESKSDAQGVAAGNIAVTQDFSALGKPVTVGMGLLAGAGVGVDFRDVPESGGAYASIVALDIISSVGIDVTERLSVGGSLMLSNATLAGPFVGITGAASDYALLAKGGVNYRLHDSTSVGAYWRTKGGYKFENLVAFPLDPTTFLDVRLDRPEIIGLGFSNNSLLDGKLLLSVDTVYQFYSDAALLSAFYHDQLAVQVGAQYSPNSRVSLRLGYAWNENPMLEIVPNNGGGIAPPEGAAHIQYVQSLFAAIPQHRVTGGATVHDVLPGVDFDLFAGGTFETSQTFGVATATVESYWVGMGITWRFGRGACEEGEWQ